MNRVRVSSSNLASIGYDPDNQILEVEFRNHGIYQYFKVPADVHRLLMEAESHGKYFNEHVKKAGYQFRKIK
jgi:hypothetical protein